MLSLYRIQSCITISFHASHFPLLFYFGKKKNKKKKQNYSHYVHFPLPFITITIITP